MASTCAVFMAMPLAHTNNKRLTSAETFLKGGLMSSKPCIAASKTSAARRFDVKANLLKEKAVNGLTAAALTASLVIPDAAQAAEGIPPSLKNLLLSVAAGGVVVVAILGAVIAVSNFDPVKRG